MRHVRLCFASHHAHKFVRMQGFWENARRRDARSYRRMRQKNQRHRDLILAIADRRHFCGRMRFVHQCGRKIHCMNTMSKRRAILIQPSGVCSPVVLLPSTKNTRGIIGSFLGGNEMVVAHRDLLDGTALVAFSVNDEVCDEKWTADAINILTRSMLTPPQCNGPYGNVLVVRMLSEDGMVCIGDLVIRHEIPRELYCTQTEAPEDTT